MIHPYQVYSLSKLYHEEALQEASTRHPARSDGSRASAVSLLLVMLALVAILLAASGCTDSASSSVNADAVGSTAVASDTDASRYAGMRPSTSWECYTFYSDGTVELRHGGTSAINDSGSYQGDATFGEIVWDSGRGTSTVVADGDGLIIDDLKVSPVDRCF